MKTRLQRLLPNLVSAAPKGHIKKLRIAMEGIREPNNLLRHEREKRGWSQSRLAELIGTDTSMISRWERGARKPDPFYREKLCTLFGKDAVELGFINTQPKVESSHPNTTQEATRIERRTVVQGILGFTGVTLVTSNELLN